MICSKCKIKETDSTSGWCWWCINNTHIESKMEFNKKVDDLRTLLREEKEKINHITQ